MSHENDLSCEKEEVLYLLQKDNTNLKQWVDSTSNNDFSHKQIVSRFLHENVPHSMNEIGPSTSKENDLFCNVLLNLVFMPQNDLPCVQNINLIDLQASDLSCSHDTESTFLCENDSFCKQQTDSPPTSLNKQQINILFQKLENLFLNENLKSSFKQSMHSCIQKPKELENKTNRNITKCNENPKINIHTT